MSVLRCVIRCNSSPYSVKNDSASDDDNSDNNNKNNNIKQNAPSKNNRKKMIKTQLLIAKTFRLKSSSANFLIADSQVYIQLKQS